MPRTILTASVLASAALASAAHAQLYSNATRWGMSNAPIGLATGIFGLSDTSVPQAGNGVAGFGASGAVRLADDFTVPAGQVWSISEVRFFGYVTNSTASNPYSSWTLRVWNGPPDDPASLLVFGDTTTNRMASVSNQSPIFRLLAGAAFDSNRQVRDVHLSTSGLVLTEGTYWLDFGNSAGFVPALTAPGVRDIPGWNGQQLVSGAWAPAIDTGTSGAGPSGPQDFPFILEGTASILTPYEITWSSIDGGGETSSGGVFTVTGSIGQPDAGTQTDGTPTCLGGFWGAFAAVCYANCDGSTVVPVLSAADFTCFLSKFRAGDSYANCDGSTGSPLLSAADFTCFLGKFRAGCP